MSQDTDRAYLAVFQPSGLTAYVSHGATLLEAAQTLAIQLDGVCGGKGTCGKCKVRVKENSLDACRGSLSPLSDAERKLLTQQEQREGHRLACQARIQGDLVIFVPEEDASAEQATRKALTERHILSKPAVNRLHVEMAPAGLDDSLGDWERLQAEIERQFGLGNLTIDHQALTRLPGAVRQGNWKATALVWMNREVIGVEPGRAEESYGLAVDVGTTTVACYLCDLGTGDVIGTESMTNPQTAYGGDVISRIGYAMTQEDGLGRMRQAVIEGINDMAGRVAARAGIEPQDIVDMTVVGNTCMHHIFLNIDPQYMGRAPFAPAIHHSIDVKARELGLSISPGAYVHVLPVEAGFVGADNVGVLIAEEPYYQDRMVLTIDIGTNGELVLGNQDGLVSASCATGPAFEGANITHGMRAAPGAIERIEIDPQTCDVRFEVIGGKGLSTGMDGTGARGICGSGIIDAVAQMFLAGIINARGQISAGLDTSRLRRGTDGMEFVIARANETSTGQDIVVTQGDVRNIQMAKGALYAGAKILMRRLGVESLDEIVLAGAFGSYINTESAAVIGMFPDCALENIRPAGNAAGEGARLALLNVDKRTEADRVAGEVEYVELTLEPDFHRAFAEAMWFPHMKDDFPHLAPLLKPAGPEG
jgi:uncharacterized 2Fe-2S/4Fe-4S cluster protein (DUF4445 family)